MTVKEITLRNSCRNFC